MNERKIDAFKELLANISDRHIVNIVNEYLESHEYYIINDMGDLDDFCDNQMMSFTDLARYIDNGKFDIDDSWFALVNDTLISSHYISDIFDYEGEDSFWEWLFDANSQVLTDNDVDIEDIVRAFCEEYEITEEDFHKVFANEYDLIPKDWDDLFEEYESNQPDMGEKVFENCEELLKEDSDYNAFVIKVHDNDLDFDTNIIIARFPFIQGIVPYWMARHIYRYFYSKEEFRNFCTSDIRMKPLKLVKGLQLTTEDKTRDMFEDWNSQA